MHLTIDFFMSNNYGPLHVLWQVSFGCWVTWSISSWQEYYKSVFFFNFTKLQFLNDKIYSYTKKNYLALGNLILTFKWENWEHSFAKSSGLNCWETEKEVLLLILSFGKEDTLIILLSAWDRSRDSTAKRNLSKDM